MKDKVKEIMINLFELDNSINDDISQSNTDKWDSLNHLNLIVEIEDEFNVSFTPEEIASMLSLDDIVKKLKKVK